MRQEYRDTKLQIAKIAVALKGTTTFNELMQMDFDTRTSLVSALNERIEAENKAMSKH